MSYASAAEIRMATAELLRAPRRVTVAEAAEQYLRIATPGGFSGGWDPRSAPYMVEPMNATASRHVEGVVFCGPAQSLKTFSMLGGRIAYTTVCNPADMLVIQMSQDTARDWSRKELDRWISSSPEIAAKLSPRARDDNTYDKFWRDGSVLKIGWPSKTQVASKSVRDALATDYDRMPDDIDGEGSLWVMLLQRIKAWGSSGIVIVESSPGRDVEPEHARWVAPHGTHEAPPVGGVLGLYNLGDRGRWYWPCPHCGEYFHAEPGVGLFGVPPLEELRELFKSYSVSQLVSRYELPVHRACGARIEPEHKLRMNLAGAWLAEGERIDRRGEITGTARKSSVASYWLGGVAAVFQHWGKLVQKHIAAAEHWARTGEVTTLKATINTDQGAPFWVPVAGKSADAARLQAAAEDWQQETVPEGVRFLLAAVDVQGNRFVVQVIGIGPSATAPWEWWVVDRYTLRTSRRETPGGELLPLSPATYLEDWERITERVVQRRYQLPDGRFMPITRVAVDSGGAGKRREGRSESVTEKAYAWWRGLQARGLGWNVRLVKGASSKDAPRVVESYPDTSGRKDRGASTGDVPVLMLNTNVLKDAVAADLERFADGQGVAHLPTWLSAEVFAEFTAEVRTAAGWVNPSSARNEAFDLAVYPRALCIQLELDRPGWWDSPPAWALPWDRNPTLVSATADKAPPAQRSFADIARALNG